MSCNVGSVTIDLDKVVIVRVAVENTAICNSIPEIWSTSGLVSAMLNCAGRPKLHNVSIATIGSGMVENVGKAVGISAICHSIPEIQSTCGLVSTSLNFDSRPTSDSVGGMIIGSGMVENVGKAVEFSVICNSIPEIQSASGLHSAILNSGSRLATCSVRH
jgi:hypothetical protein